MKKPEDLLRRAEIAKAKADGFGRGAIFGFVAAAVLLWWLERMP
jgi:hypothetical protein